MKSILIYFLILLIFILVKNKIYEGVAFKIGYMKDEYKNWNVEYNDKINSFINKENGHIISSSGQFNSKISIYRCNYKNKTLEILSKNKLPITKFYLWDKKQSKYKNLKQVNKLKFPLVAKPNKGTHGRNVNLNIQNESALLNIINTIPNNNEVLIEEQVKGDNYRIMVFNNQIIDIIKRINPYVIGNDKDTLQILIDKYNVNQSRNQDYKIHNFNSDLIKDQGYDFHSIIPKNKRVLLTDIVNYHNGSKISRIPIEEVHEDNIKLFLEVNRVLGLDLSGVDYMGPDLSISYKNVGHIIEVNAEPDMKIHYKVDKKNKNYAIKKFVENIHNIFN